MKKLCFVLLFKICLLYAEDEKALVIITPSYNNEKWITNNLQSIIQQNYTNFRIIYINDCSSDDTGNQVENFCKELCSFRSLCFEEQRVDGILVTANRFKQQINSKHVFFTLVHNTKRCGALENLYRAIHSCEDHEIVVLVDGDDWLYHNDVLKTLNKVYSTGTIWMTHGRFIEYPNGGSSRNRPIPEEVIHQNSIRQFHSPSHLRTFYAWLFKKIALHDLLFGDIFFPMTWDKAIMFPITEMAAERHCFINEINYVYNEANPINDYKVNIALQSAFDSYIRTLPSYLRIEDNDDKTFLSIDRVFNSLFSNQDKPAE